MTLLSIPKAAKAKGIGYSLLAKLVKAGKVRVVNIPGRVHPLIDLADLDACAETWKSGSIGGSKEEPEPMKSYENVALLNRSHSTDIASADDAKFLWMTKFKSHARRS